MVFTVALLSYTPNTSTVHVFAPPVIILSVVWASSANAGRINQANNTTDVKKYFFIIPPFPFFLFVFFFCHSGCLVTPSASWNNKSHRMTSLKKTIALMARYVIKVIIQYRKLCFR